MKRFIICVLCTIASVPSFSQLLHIEAPADTTVTNPAFLYSTMGVERHIFNEKGVADYNNPLIDKQLSMVLFLDSYNTFCLLVEPGQTLNVKLSRDKKSGLFVPSYKGKNAVMTELANELLKYSPGRNVSSKTTFGPDTITYEAEMARQAKEMKRITRIAGKFKNADDRALQQKAVKEKYLCNCITLYLKRAQEENVAPINVPELQQFLSNVNPNDTTIDNNLRSLYLNGKYPVVVNGESDVNEWMDVRIDGVLKYITEPSIRISELKTIAYQVAYASAPNLQTERLWARLKEAGGEAATGEYQKVIDAKKRTAAGTKCPDFSFTDPEGNEHRVSELFGRTLIIDVWATWCGPCKEQIPYIEKLVEAYKDDKRLQFVSISIDTNRQAWLDMINADKPAWPQYHVAGDAYKALLDGFAINGIPRFIIIKSDGTIGMPDAFRPSDEEFDAKIRPYLAN